LKKLLLIFLLVPAIASAGDIYAGPSGSAGGAGTYADPYDLATGLANVGGSTVLWLKGGIYSVDAYYPNGLYWGKSGQTSRIIACSDERPIITSTIGLPPQIWIYANTSTYGVWFGGQPDTAAPGGHASDISTTGNNDSLQNCVFFGYQNGVTGGNQDAQRIISCLFANFPVTIWAYHMHMIYISDSNSGDWNKRDVIYRNVFVNQVDGYAIHLEHYPGYVNIERNFCGNVNYFESVSNDANPVHEVYVRDNIYWSSHRYPASGSGYGGINNTMNTSNPHDHLLMGSYQQSQINDAPNDNDFYFNGPGLDSCRWVNPRLAAWKKTADQGNVSNYMTGTNPDTINYSTQLSTYLGVTGSQIDSAVSRLGQYFNQSNSAIQADSRITTEWNVILTALDTWAGQAPAAPASGVIRRIIKRK
jgi:hypothetical protein